MNMLKSKSSLLLIIFMAFVMLFSAGCFNTPPEDNNNTDDPGINQPGDDDKDEPTERQVINIVGFGDSISAGYALSGSNMYDSYVSYETGVTEINAMCYTNLIAQGLANENTTVNAKNYAKSGDKTQDLIAKLNDSETYPTLQSDVQNADIITLCIGANNVLGVALDNIADYLTGGKTLDEINTLLDQGVAQFKQDYTNTIIPYLTQCKGKVYVMTIYDPYKYFDTTEIELTGEESLTKTMIQYYVLPQFETLKATAISHLNEVNEYIKAQNVENVVVVDVNASFEALSKTRFRLYINADSSKISIDADTFTIEDAYALQSDPHFDPHPTSHGQQYIADLFLQGINPPAENEEANQE